MACGVCMPNEDINIHEQLGQQKPTQFLLASAAQTLAACYDNMCCELSQIVSAAPEVISAAAEYDGRQADVWSTGVMLYIMLYCNYPFERSQDEGDRLRFQKVCRHLGACNG